MVACFFSSRRRHTRLQGDWSSDVCSSDLRSIQEEVPAGAVREKPRRRASGREVGSPSPALGSQWRARDMKELSALPVTAAILDTSGTIVAVNATWKDFARQNGLRLTNFGIGSNYLQFCVSDAPYPSLSATKLKELLAGQKKLLTLIYPCDSATSKRWF